MIQPEIVAASCPSLQASPVGLAGVIVALLAAGEVTRAPVDPAWPLHRALLELRKRLTQLDCPTRFTAQRRDRIRTSACGLWALNRLCACLGRKVSSWRPGPAPRQVGN
jgi:hypothetical protein